MQQLLLLNSKPATANAASDAAWKGGAVAGSGPADSGFNDAMSQVRRNLDDGFPNQAGMRAPGAFGIAGAATLEPGAGGQRQYLTSSGWTAGTFLPPLGNQAWAGQTPYSVPGQTQSELFGSELSATSGPMLLQELTAQLSGLMQQEGVQEKLESMGLDPELLKQLQQRLDDLTEALSALDGTASNDVALAMLMAGQGLVDDPALNAIREKLDALMSENGLAQSDGLVQPLHTALNALTQFAKVQPTTDPSIAQAAPHAQLLGGIMALNRLRGEGSSAGNARPNADLRQWTESLGATASTALSSSASPEGSGTLSSSASGYGSQSGQSPMLSTSYMQGPGTLQMSAESDQNFRQTMESALTPAAKLEVAAELPDDSVARLNELAANKPAQNTQSAANLRPYSSSVNTPVGDPEWTEKMNEKVIWMSSRGIQSAQIHLNPAELGPVDVKVSVQNDQTVVHFNVQNTTVRELLESNVHRLREMMDSGGVNLSQVDVEERSADQQGFARQFRDDDAGSQGSASNERDGGESGDASAESARVAVSSLDNISIIDDYA